MWWRTERTAKIPRRRLEPISESPDPDQWAAALDTLGAILRNLGTLSPDDEDGPTRASRGEFEAWARHLLVLAPAPGANGTAPTSRNWSGVRRFVAAHIRALASSREDTLKSYRGAVTLLVHAMKDALSDDEQADRDVGSLLERLRSVAESGSAEELKHEALCAVGSISGLLVERKRTRQTKLAELGTQVRTLTESLEQARRDGTLDPLTRLYNRKAFDEYLTRTVEVAAVFGRPACLIMLDLDHFKAVNDTHGHPVGDLVLRRTADAVSLTFKRKGDLVARYGGEEFAIVLPETSVRDATMLADRMLAVIRALDFESNGRGFKVTASAGVAGLAPAEDTKPWIERADRALYEAKRAGRDRFVIADESTTDTPQSDTHSQPG